jgi:hypothetical protein
MKTPDIFDLYTDYLITSFSYTTATGLRLLTYHVIVHSLLPHFFFFHAEFLCHKIGWAF